MATNSVRAMDLAKPAIRVAAAGLGAAVAGPLGGALGVWLGGVLGASAAEIINAYAQKFGEDAGKKLLDQGADSLIERFKPPSSDLEGAYREALRRSIAEINDCGLLRGFEDWVVHWDRALVNAAPLRLSTINPHQLLPGTLSDIFESTMESLDAQGLALTSKSLSFHLQSRPLPSNLLSLLKDRLPELLPAHFKALLVTPAYDAAWKELDLVFQGFITSALQSIDRKTDVLPQMAEDTAAIRAGLKASTVSCLPPFATVPEYPPNFIDRPELSKLVVDRLLAYTSPVGLTALAGMGGVGKTIVALSVCHNSDVRRTFENIVWLTCGNEPRINLQEWLAIQVKHIAHALNQKYEVYSLAEYRGMLRERAVLIVLDDVWDQRDVDSFRPPVEGRSRLLYTSRNRELAGPLAASNIDVGCLDEKQARAFLRKWSGHQDSNLPEPYATQILGECKGLVLGVAMIGAALHEQDESAWSAMVRDLRQARLKYLDRRPSDYQYETLHASIAVSVDALDPSTKKAYLELAVLLEDMPAPDPVLQALWGGDFDDINRLARKLVGRSLATRDAQGALRLHDLQLDFIRALSPDRKSLGLIHEALRLSAHVIQNDPQQFAPQLVGRLIPFSNSPQVQNFLDQIAKGAARPWLRPLNSGLRPPGTELFRTLKARSGGFFDVAVTPDGTRAVSASSDHTLKVWDIETGRALHTLKGHSREVFGVAVTPDGTRAVSASSDRTLKVWDIENGRALRTLEGHSYTVMGVAVTPDGTRAVSASDDDTLKVWDLHTGRELRTLQGHAGGVMDVAVTPDGTCAVSASDDNTLKVWDLHTGRELRTLEGHSDPVSGVAVTSDGGRAVSGSWDHTLKVWDLQTGIALRTVKVGSDLINDVAVVRDGTRTISASSDGTLKIWDLETGRALRTLRDHSGTVNGVAVTSDGGRAVSASSDGTLKIWELQSGRASHILDCHSRRVNGVAVTFDAKRAISASDDRTLKIWDLESGRTLRTLEGHSGEVLSVSVIPDGTRAVSASWDHTLKVWDIESGRELRTLEGHAGLVSAVAVIPDGTCAVSASWDRSLKVWDIESGRALRTLEGHSDPVSAVAVTPNGTHAVSASRDHTLKVWDIESGRALRTLEGHSDPVSAVAVTPHGTRAVSASGDRTLKVWDIESGRTLRTLKGHSDAVSGLVLTPDGRFVVSASRDQSLKVWNIESGLCVATFRCDAAPLCCSCAEYILVVGDAAGGVNTLRLEVDEI